MNAFIQVIYDKIYKLIFGGKDNIIAELEIDLAGKTMDLEESLKTIQGLQQDLADLQEDLESLNYDPEEKIYWNNKRPKADIYYRGRTIPQTKTMIDVDVKTFLMPEDAKIHYDLRKYGLYVDTPKVCDADILKIYKHTRTKKINPYKYIYDKDNLGLGEFWMYPFELRAKGKGDCDDWANELASYLIAARVPSWRVRIVCGMTYSDFGHSTVYVLADDLETWVHINSTTPISMIKANKLTDLPHSNDPNDGVGIRDVWFSFNDKYAWHTFETSASEDGFKKESKKLFKIEAKK